MERIFEIEYHTVFGQELVLNIIGGKRLVMHTSDGATWRVAADLQLPASYYYSVQRGGDDERCEWHRIPHILRPDDKRNVVRDWWVDDPYAGCSALRLAGTIVPVFSLRSEASFGVGDFGDLKKMVDWVAKVGQRILQILPINDTTQSHTWRDSYPYNPVSIFALHPIYADLNALPALRSKTLKAEMDALQKELNALPEMDYERVTEAKNRYLHAVFAQAGKRTMATKDYQAFVAANGFWLESYATFCMRRDGETVKEYYYYVQYVLARQMEDAHRHARRMGVLLKGDIPIGVNRHGCDVELDPECFNMNGQAGAPPDDFSADGQNWGFPTYNWDRMVADGCQWWVRRLQAMSRYFDAFRIDHVLGFFRIWQIPVPHKSGLEGRFVPAMGMDRMEIESYGLRMDNAEREAMFVKDESGLLHPRIAANKEKTYSLLPDYEKRAFDRLHEQYFYRRHNQFWYDEAMKKLPALVGATDMIVCAEDLGMVPDCVPWVLRQLHILSLEVMSMPKALGMRFGQPAQNPYLSVCTLSSHDMPTLRQWWDEDYDRAQDYFNNQMHWGGPAPHPLPANVAREIIARQVASPSMFCIQILQDWLATDERLRNPDPDAERINIPANPEHYWRWRMHVTIEDLMANEQFCDRLRNLISGR